MKPGQTNNFILNGFDRCGSSAISRVLGTHPGIEIIMQPFNSGSIREKLYQIIDETNATAADYDFFRKLEDGILERSYIKSHWHENFSTTPDFIEGKLHLIKTTQNHLTISWVRNNFPRIENWGIWRDPNEILASLIRNNFHTSWYADAAPEMVKTVKCSPLLDATFGAFTTRLKSPVREMAFILAARSWYYFYHLEDSKIIFYREFVKDRTHALNHLVGYFDLDPYDFGKTGDADLNITGKKYVRDTSHLESIPHEDRGFCEDLFQPLNELVNNQITS